MRVLSCLVFLLTAFTGWLSFSHSGSTSEVLKLAYAYLALMSVVCTMIMLTMKPRAQQAPVAKAEVGRPEATEPVTN